MDPVTSTLVVVEDRHAGRLLDAVLRERDRDGSASTLVLSSDPLLVMRLRRAGRAARLTVDGLDACLRQTRDRIALEGVARAYGDGQHDYSILGAVRYAPFLEYTLIPPFIKAVRNVSALGDVVRDHRPHEMLIVGGGDLPRAAALVARHAAVPVRWVGASLWARLSHAFARLRAGRRTRWVNTTFRALVLEPAFLALLALRGIVARRPRRRPAGADPLLTLLVAGDRFTRDLVEDLRDRVDVIVAGATQPGRQLFRDMRDIATLEAFGTLRDVLAAIRTACLASAHAVRLVCDRSHSARFESGGVNYWPLVRGPVALQLAIWPMFLGHLRALIRRATRTHSPGRLLVSQDVTAYNRVLVDAAREAGMDSIGLQHGIMAEANGHSTTHVDRMVVWGEASIEWYRKVGPQRAQFVVAGNGRFDTLAKRLSAPARRRDVGAPFTVVVCTGFVSDYSVAASEYENLLLLEAAVSWARGRPNVRIIHKMHPGEEPTYYQLVARELGWSDGFLSVVREKPPLHDVLEQADVLLAGYSTTVLEAVALGARAIVLDAIARMHMLPLDKCPDITITDSVVQCHEQLDALWQSANRPRAASPATREFLQHYLFEIDGLATERAQRLVMGDAL